MKPKEYVLLVECIERGVNYGYSKAFKYQENPASESIKSSIEGEVLDDICLHFEIDHETDSS